MSELEIVKEKVELPVADGTRMAAYVARPKDGGPHPGLLVFQEAFGVNHHIRMWRSDLQRRDMRRLLRSCFIAPHRGI